MAVTAKGFGRLSVVADLQDEVTTLHGKTVRGYKSSHLEIFKPRLPIRSVYEDEVDIGASDTLCSLASPTAPFANGRSLPSHDPAGMKVLLLWLSNLSEDNEIYFHNGRISGRNSFLDLIFDFYPALGDTDGAIEIPVGGPGMPGTWLKTWPEGSADLLTLGGNDELEFKTLAGLAKLRITVLYG